MEEISVLARIKETLKHHYTVLKNIRKFILFSKFISIIISLALCYIAVQNNYNVFLSLSIITAVVFIFVFKIVLDELLLLGGNFEEVHRMIDYISECLRKDCMERKMTKEHLKQTQYNIIFDVANQIEWNDRFEVLILLCTTLCLYLSRIEDDSHYILLSKHILLIINLVLSVFEYLSLTKTTQKHEKLRTTLKKFVSFSDSRTDNADYNKHEKAMHNEVSSFIFWLISLNTIFNFIIERNVY